MMNKTIKNQESRPSIQLGMHADNWRVLSGNLKQAVDSAVENKLDKIEFGLIDGQYFVGGLGYEPSFPMDGDEKKLKRMLDENGLQVSDRKSTRLNSSHVAISYAVFCLKKKKEEN